MNFTDIFLGPIIAAVFFTFGFMNDSAFWNRPLISALCYSISVLVIIIDYTLFKRKLKGWGEKK